MTSLALKTFVWKVDPALSVADADAKGVALRLRGGSLLVQPDDAVIMGVETRGVGRVCVLLRVPVSPSHWFYGYKWLRCRRSRESGVSVSHDPSPLFSPLVTAPEARFLSFQRSPPKKSPSFTPHPLATRTTAAAVRSRRLFYRNQTNVEH